MRILCAIVCDCVLCEIFREAERNSKRIGYSPQGGEREILSER